MNRCYKHISIFIGMILALSCVSIISPIEIVSAGSYDGEDLALAILANQSYLISSSYTDTDRDGHRQGIVLSSLGTMVPTDGSTFALLSTGIAGADPVTTGGDNPGDERGTWFKNRYGHPRDKATLTMTIKVPIYMHYLYYDLQFFSAESPEYVGSPYNDALIVTVNSPSQGITSYVLDVNSGDFILDSNDISGTGFDIFAQSGIPDAVDWVDTTPRAPGADAGATAIITRAHPVSPLEEVTIEFKIKDTGDNMLDSAIFIDNLMFSGYEKTDIIARKTVQILNGEPLECGDTMKYTITISNIGTANQNDNEGNEFEDAIPNNSTYKPNSATATSGVIAYNEEDNKITWNGEILSESSVALTFEVIVDEGLANGTIISNQGMVYWDSNENGTNDATEYTDDPSVDDNIDLDGDNETDDDDPTNKTVFVFEPPSCVTEDFSDDAAGGKATQTFYYFNWFETDENTYGGNFEVASDYRYSTPKSFKTQLRSIDDKQYWHYNLTKLDGDLDWWEILFACGNASEESNLHIDFKNNNGEDIAKIKFEYTHNGKELPMDWILKLYFWNDPSTGWNQLSSNYTNGSLCNNWYKLRIEKNGLNHINYSLYEKENELVDFKTGDQLNAPFSDFTELEWYSTKNPIVCPMFFWDEHVIGLT